MCSSDLGGTIIVLPTATDGQRTIATGAYTAAIAYGAATNSHALLVYKDGLIELEHYYPGHSAEGITTTQSMHKSVLAMLVGIAVEEAYIPSVDAPASTWLTEWANDDRAHITIRQMLQQTSGIDFDSCSPNITNGLCQLMMGDEIGRASCRERV